MAPELLLIVLAALPFAGSVVAALLPANARNAEAWLAGAVAVAGVVVAIILYPALADGAVLHFKVAWMPIKGADFNLRLDGFAWLFSLLITGIGALVVLYARYYLSAADPMPRFFSFLLAFMGSMLGLVLSGNLIQLVFFWELTSLFSFLLIGYWHYNAAARDGARLSLTVTALGGLALLGGVVLLGRITGSYDLDVVLAAGETIRAHPWYLPVLGLVLLGAFTKSAQFPFHFWLPQAMAAPTPVSAYLHSATMVKAGVFLLARLWPVLAGTDAWFWLVGGTGLVTLLFAGWCAIFQQDLKGLLAYSTISNLGLITLLLGLNSPLAAVAAVFHIINHATFKASLFMAAGIIDHEAGTRDIRRLSGLYRLMPYTATLAMVACAAMAGVPLLNGFISKEMFFTEAILATTPLPLLGELLPYAATLAGMFAVAYSLRFIHGAFFGPPPLDLPHMPQEPPRWMRFPVELLVLVCLLVGILPTLTLGSMLQTAVRAILGADTPIYSLSVWHGFNLAVLMSAMALVGGVVMYRLLHGYLAHSPDGPPVLRRIAGQRVFERILVTLSWRWARTLRGLLGTHRLQPQLRALVVVAVLVAALPLLRHWRAAWPGFAGWPDPVLAGVWLIGAACAIGAAWQAKYHRLAALILMGGAGLATCLTFVWFSAPDLALTQLLVEIVTTVLMLLGLRWLPKRFERIDETTTLPARLRRAADFALAAGAGIGVAMLAYLTMTRPAPQSIARYFLEHALPQGGGHNVVNVILVDFRGFDTLGEISVLAVVAITVYALLRRFRPAQESIGAPEQQRVQNAWEHAHPDRQDGDSVAEQLLVPGVLMRWIFPPMLTIAVYLFMRGHDLPGGGFVAGLVVAIALIVQYMAAGTRRVEAQLRVHPLRWMAIGLLLALLTGVGAWLAGYPFLTSHLFMPQVPGLGRLPLASALFFDLGVFALVVGATTLILIALAHQSLRSQRPARTGNPATEA